MKTAIMQPYFFPYIGYWQLINAVDVFVILDDVNFIIRGYINRNSILLNGRPHLFSIPLAAASQNKLISETKLNFFEKEKEKFLKTIQVAYKKAPYFCDFYPVLRDIVFNPTDDLTEFIEKSFYMTLGYLGIQKKILRSSKIIKQDMLKGESRIIEVCKKLDTNMYINPLGGKDLYHETSFAKENMELRFIRTKFDKIKYLQYNNEFVANLSFLDILMFNSIEKILIMLEHFCFEQGEYNEE